jgi:hypothetical protein
LRSERLGAALQVLQTVLSESAADAAEGPSTAYHLLLAALADIQSVLDFFTARAATSSETVKAAVTSAVMTALLDHHRCTVLSQLLEAPVAAATTVSVRTAVMTRMLDVMLWVVDAVCTPLVQDCAGEEAEAEDTLASPDLHVPTLRKKLWYELTAHQEAVLCVASIGLASTSSGACRWGASVHGAVVRLLEALQLTCFFLCRHIDDASCAGESAAAEGDREGAAQLRRTASQLGHKLASDEALQLVAAQLQMPVQVVDEVDGFTRKSHTFSYDVLRHGALAEASAGETDKAAGEEEVPPAVPRTLWMLLDSTRRPQSPLELYMCAVSYLSHAFTYRSTFPVGADGGRVAISVAVWKAYVSVLERALQEGETALSVPPPLSPSPAQAASAAAAVTTTLATAVVTANHASAVPYYSSPLLTRINCYTTTRDYLAALPLVEESMAESDPATPCESPVTNAHGGVAGKPVDDIDRQKTSATAVSSRRSSALPPCTMALAGDAAAVVSSVDTARLGGTAGGAAMSAPSTAQPATALMQGKRGSYGADNGLCPDHGSVCGAEDSTQSNDVTVAGVTDGETVSLYGESAGLATRARSRPILIATAKAAAPTTTTSNTHYSLSHNPRSPFHHAVARSAEMLSPKSPCGLPNHNFAAQRNGGTAVQGLSLSPPRQHPLCKSAASPAASNAPLYLSAVMEPLSLTADGAGRLLSHGSSKSSCLQRERQIASSIAATAAAAGPAPVLRSVFPSHALLTKEVLASLALLTQPTTCCVGTMAALVDANVLTVMSELLEYPGSSMQEVVTAALENCFAFWESTTSQSPEKLLSLTSTPPRMKGAEQGKNTTPVPVEEDSLELPVPLRAFLHTFSAFLGWDGEGWAELHTQYTQRALRLLINVLDYFKNAAACRPGLTAGRSYASRRPHDAVTLSTLSPQQLLAQVVHFLLRHGVIAHIWCCLSMDATQVPGAMGKSASATSTASSKSGRGGPSSSPSRAQMNFEPACMYSYGCFLYGTPTPVSHALLSEAQCTAMHLLYTLAKSLDWSAAQATSHPPFKATAATSGSNSCTDNRSCLAPSWHTYKLFMEESFKHLPACANCLRRCTYTRSQSRPIVPDDHEALSRVLYVLRVVFVAMATGVQSAAGDDGDCDVDATAAAASLRHTWMQQIADSQVLDVLAHIGTSAELVSFELPRLCIFTLRSYLEHVHVLTPCPLLPRGGKGGLNKTPASLAAQRSTTTSTTTKTFPPLSSTLTATSPLPLAAANTAAARAARAWTGLAALQALIIDPPPPPLTKASASTWGRGAARESLLAILLARMQRRCAGQSASASVPLQLEVLALLTDVLTNLVDNLPTSLSHLSADDCAAVFDTAAAVEVVRVSQRVVSAVIEYRVWSGTAQELRYLDPNVTTPVKEALRFVCRVAQLVNGSLRALLTVQQQQQQQQPSGATKAEAGTATTNITSDSVSDTLGKHTAAVLLAESVSMSFAFHVVTMDFPLALAGLVNGTRWQTCGKQSSSQTTSATQGGGVSSSSRSSASSNGRTASSASPRESRSTGVVVTMKPQSPSLVPQREHERTEFDDEDRRETCEVAASTLVELLCALRRVEALLGCAVLLSPAVLGALPYHGSSSSNGTSSTAATPVGTAGSVSADAQWAQGDPPHQLDVVVVQNSTAEFAAVVTSLLYPRAVAALAESLPPPPAATAVPSNPPVPVVPTMPERAPIPAPSPNTTTAEDERDDPRNWRRTEQQWRRRVPVLRTAVKDALHALDLTTLDRYLALCRRHEELSDGVRQGGAVVAGREVESRWAEEAVLILASEKKRYLATF